MATLAWRKQGRVALLIVAEVVALVALLVIVANLIPRVAPPPSVPTPAIPREALHECPRTVPGCR